MMLRPSILLTLGSLALALPAPSSASGSTESSPAKAGALPTALATALPAAPAPSARLPAPSTGKAHTLPRVDRPADVTGLYVANRLNYRPLPRIERVPSTDGWEHWFKLEEGLITLRPDKRFIASFRYYRQHVRPRSPVRPGPLLNESYKGKYSLNGTTITFVPDKTKQTRGVKPIVGTLTTAQLTIPYIVAQGQSAHPLRLDLRREGSW